MTAVSRDNPLDRALALTLAGEHEQALAIVTKLLESLPAHAPALFVAASTLGSFQQPELSHSAFELSLRHAIRAGNFPLAAAACCELDQGQVGASAHLEQLANTFGKGSEHLLERRVPPELKLSIPPSAECEERGADLLERVEAALSISKKELEAFADQPLHVPPQIPFSSLEPPALLALMSAFEVLTVGADQVLIEEGTPGSEAYVLARGELEVQRRSREEAAEPIRLARLGAGALFGEMSLLSRSPRAASVVACRPSVVLRVAKQALDAVAEAQPEVGRVLAQFTRRRMIDNLVRTSSILSAVQPDKRATLLERFVTKTFEAGEKLITQGQESSGLYLVASGSLSVMHRSDGENLAISKLGPGEVVGEVALVLRRPSNADVLAEHPTVTLHLPREAFLELIKAHPEVLAELYELAVKRDEETRSLVAQEATEADEFVLL